MDRPRSSTKTRVREAQKGMSGRTVWYRDGERTVGYRKTDRRQSRAAIRPPVELLLRLCLPTSLGFALTPGPIPGLIGVTIAAGGIAEIRGANRDWIKTQAAALIKRLARDRPGGRMYAVWSEAGEQTAIPVGLDRPQGNGVFEITWASGRPAVIIDGHGMRPFISED